MDGTAVVLGAKMIARLLDNILGRGAAAVTVPTLDGALRPNRLLDEATDRMPLEDVDCLAALPDGLRASAGRCLYRLADQNWCQIAEYDDRITALAAVAEGGLAVALACGEIRVLGGTYDGLRYHLRPTLGCITALAVAQGQIYVANGSAHTGADNWQLDLLQGNASGSLHRIDLETGDNAMICAGLAYPAGLVMTEKGLVFSEAWKHQITRIDPQNPINREVLYADLAGYPGRLSAMDGGFLLAVFAPRSQLVEFVLREPAYRQRMLDTVPQSCWISPKLRAGRSFYEPLQGGSVKQLGRLKPWAPTLSAGLCVQLNAGFQPVQSLHSRADGATHGVTSALAHAGRIYVAARGDGVVVSAQFNNERRGA